MTDQNQNVCPYCGTRVSHVHFNRLGKTEGYQASCKNCGAVGPVNVDADDVARSVAVHAFCHPAHLLEGKTLVGSKEWASTCAKAHKWERICDGEELADVAGEEE